MLLLWWGLCYTTWHSLPGSMELTVTKMTLNRNTTMPHRHPHPILSSPQAKPSPAQPSRTLPSFPFPFPLQGENMKESGEWRGGGIWLWQGRASIFPSSPIHSFFSVLRLLPSVDWIGAGIVKIGARGVPGCISLFSGEQYPFSFQVVSEAHLFFYFYFCILKFSLSLPPTRCQLGGFSLPLASA